MGTWTQVWVGYAWVKPWYPLKHCHIPLGKEELSQVLPLKITLTACPFPQGPLSACVRDWDTCSYFAKRGTCTRCHWLSLLLYCWIWSLNRTLIQRSWLAWEWIYSSSVMNMSAEPLHFQEVKWEARRGKGWGEARRKGWAFSLQYLQRQSESDISQDILMTWESTQHLMSRLKSKI